MSQATANYQYLNFFIRYAYQKAFDKALAIYLRLKNKDVFELIKKHSLYAALSDQIKPLMALDSDQATRLLLDNMDKIPVSISKFAIRI